MARTDLTFYQALPYRLEIESFDDEDDGERYFRAEYPEIPGCFAIARDRLDVVQLAHEVFDELVEMYLEQGKHPPMPDRGVVARRPGGQRKPPPVPDVRAALSVSPSRLGYSIERIESSSTVTSKALCPA